ncbi:hypothetical protein F0562_024950 [Nyssa sinensis]|uniref:Pentatricopeptide repeat-containing protein n=1 Tax=Nyssa sinensis TaxID=561372 RepID=A0A5J5BGD2_9ASTE|nr:hypothetical protein F0562_024950 [Nyssa sinensis]
MVHSTPLADQFVKVGIAAVCFLSDLVNYKIPLLDGSGMLSSPQNCMVDYPGPPSNTKSSNVKNFRKDKVRVINLSAETTAGSNPQVICMVQKLKWGSATEEALGKLNCAMNAYQANQILKQLQDHSVALGFFYWLKRQSGFKHDGHTYTTMLASLAMPGNLMQEAGCERDRVTYCTLMDIHAKSGYLDFAMEMYQRMQQAGLSPDTFTYGVVINCLGKLVIWLLLTMLFCEMVDQGCVPNLVTYNIMIALQAKARNYPIALRHYRDLQNAGFEPDKVTYSIVMEVLGHCGYLEEAEAVLQR